MDRHHIIPRHAGGTDDPDNLVTVTREQHAELHFARYLEHGEIGDWVAAFMLSGQTEEGEKARREIAREFMKGNTFGKANKGRKAPWAAASLPKDFIWITDGNSSRQLPKGQAIPEGWKPGRRMSEEAKKKMSMSARNRRPK